MSPRIERHLHQAGHSVTFPRKLIIQYLTSHGPTSAVGLASSLEAKIDRATIFRTLKVFRKLGIIHDVGMGPKRKVELAFGFSPHHHHLVCSRCGETISFESPQIERLVQQLTVGYGYKLEEHHLELVGRCGKCQSNLPEV